MLWSLSIKCAKRKLSFRAVCLELIFSRLDVRATNRWSIILILTRRKHFLPNPKLFPHRRVKFHSDAQKKPLKQTEKLSSDNVRQRRHLNISRLQIRCRTKFSSIAQGFPDESFSFVDHLRVINSDLTSLSLWIIFKQFYFSESATFWCWDDFPR